MPDELKNDGQDGFDANQDNTDFDQDTTVKEGEDYKPSKNPAYDAFKDRSQKREGMVPLDKVNEIVQAEVGNLRSEFYEKQEDAIIDSMTTDQGEKDSIKNHLKNTIKRTGNLIEDVKTARVLANGHKLESLSNEAKAVRRSQMQSGGSAPAEYVPDNSDALNLSDRELSMVTRFGLDPKTLRAPGKK
jgi:hypothetical protein